MSSLRFTPRTGAKEALVASETRYRRLFESAKDGILILDAETGMVVDVNPFLIKLLGFSREQFLGKAIWELGFFKDIVANQANFAELQMNEYIRYEDKPLKTIDGRRIEVEFVSNVYFVNHSKVIQCNIRDITERRRAEEKMRESEERFRVIFDRSTVGKSLTSPDGILLSVNAAFADMMGLTIKELQQVSFASVTHPEDVAGSRECLRTLLAKECSSYRMEKRYLHKDGHYVWADVSTTLLRDSQENPIYFITSILDISEHKRDEAALAASEVRYRRLFESAKDGILILDAETGMVMDVNPFLVKLLGFSREQFLGKAIWELGVFKDIVANQANFAELQMNEYIRYEDKPLETVDGRRVEVEFVSNVYMVNHRKVIQCNIRDITAHKLAEESHTRLATAVEQAVEAIIITDAAAAILYVNPGFEKTSGYTREEVIGKNPRILRSGKQDAEFYDRMWTSLSAGNAWSGRLINKRKDGTLYEEDATISPVRNAAGKIVNFVAVKRDVTHEAHLENQLRQSQKMEVVGRLAGGVAHDFNNILMAISGYCELLLLKMPHDETMRRDVLEILKAQKQGASLTRQLLAFSRKQVLEPKVFDLGVIVSSMENLLQRLIGEDINLRIQTSAEAEMVEADPNQMEQVIMNLVVNSRDAMPRGGHLTIEVSDEELDEEYARGHLDATPGPHVTLSLTDNGHGMDPKTLSHVFEPFFTTKGVEKGTGLGLAMVYGIVTQSRGSISVYSEPGLGTTFKIYLPRIHCAGRGIASESDVAPTGGSETILLVDDNESIRSAVGELIRIQGYNVLLASGGKEALETSRTYAGPIDLLVTDVVMPQMSGRELAEKLSAEREGIKILYMSGYTDDAVLQHGILSSDSMFLQKPATMAALLRKIRELLD